MALSLWDRIKIAVTPESTAEAAANEMMRTSPMRNFDPAEYGYDPHDFSSPNVYVKAKGLVKSVATDVTESALIVPRTIIKTFDSATGILPKALIVLGVFLLISVFIYAAAPALVRR